MFNPHRLPLLRSVFKGGLAKETANCQKSSMLTPDCNKMPFIKPACDLQASFKVKTTKC